MRFIPMLGPIGKTCASLAVVLAINLALVQPAAAGTTAGWTRSSTVPASVVDNLNGTWTYDYTVNNTSTVPGPDPTEPILVDWELPWFGDAGISNIRSPSNWGWSIETIGTANSATGWGGTAAWQSPSDPLYAGPGSPFTTVAEVLHWYNECWLTPNGIAVSANGTCEGSFDGAIFLGGSLSGFGFDATFGPLGAPYQASWTNLPVRTGDPPIPGTVPNSPNASVPEPGVLGLLGIGLAALMLRRRRVV